MLESGCAFYLDETGPATGIGGKTVDITEVGDEGAAIFDDFDQRRAFQRL